MKYIYIFISLVILLTSCESGFEELNTNNVDPTAIDQVLILNNAIINTSHDVGSLKYDIGIVQQIITPNSGVLTGANYNQDNRNATDDMWVDYYKTVIKHTKIIILQLEGQADKTNLTSMARIIQAYAFMVLTDTYGAVPYAEAGIGLSDDVLLPAYDSQEFIYTDLIKEVTEATTNLDVNGDAVSGEVLYSGNINQWKKLGNSLLFRIGMRLTKVNPILAEQTVNTAFTGGLFESNADNFVIRHDANYTNAIGSFLSGKESANYYLVDSFVDYLKTTSDPRLSSLAVRYVGAISGLDQTGSFSDTDANIQVGMPMGNDNGTVGLAATTSGISSFYAFSQVDKARIVTISTPMYLITYSQTQLLLAEAALNGWVGGTAENYYKNGVRAHMEQMEEYSSNSAVLSADVDAYLTANPFDTVNSLEQINTQYWVSSFLNGPESFANFRRSGFPVLNSNNYPGSAISTDFINRLTYPSSEIAINSANVEAAILLNEGPDNLETKVWWQN